MYLIPVESLPILLVAIILSFEERGLEGDHAADEDIFLEWGWCELGELSAGDDLAVLWRKIGILCASLLVDDLEVGVGGDGEHIDHLD